MSAGGRVTRGYSGEFRSWVWEEIYQAKQEATLRALENCSRARMLLGDDAWNIWVAAMPYDVRHTNELFDKAVVQLLAEIDKPAE